MGNANLYHISMIELSLYFSSIMMIVIASVDNPEYNNNNNSDIATPKNTTLESNFEPSKESTRNTTTLRLDEHNDSTTTHLDHEISSSENFNCSNGEGCVMSGSNNTDVINLENISNHTYGEEYDLEHTDDDAHGFVPNIVYVVCIYLILIIGNFGNIVIFLLMQFRFSTFSYSVYIRFLAVMDSLVLITVCAEDIADHQFNDLQGFLTFQPGFCKAWNYIYGVARLASPWFVVLFTFERFVVVIYPLKRVYFCTVKKACILSTILLFVCISENIFWVVSVIKDCDSVYLNGFIYWYRIIRMFAIESGVPCLIIFGLNAFIIRGIRRSASFREKFKGPQTASGTKSRISGENSVTVSLVVLSIMAFCTLFPIAVCEIIEFTWYETHNTEDEIPSYVIDVSRTWPLLNLVRLLNFGQNWYIMMATSAKYRQEFMKLSGIQQLFRRYQAKRDSSQSSRATQLSHIND